MKVIPAYFQLFVENNMIQLLGEDMSKYESV